MLYLLLAIFIIPGILFSLLNSGAFQTYLAQSAAKYFSNELKTEILIDRLNISPFLDITLEGVSVKDRHNNKLFFSKSVLLDFDDISFSEHHIRFNKAIISDPYIALVKYKDEKQLNFQFIADYFASTDTTKSPTKSIWQYSIMGINLMNAHFIYDIQKKDTIKYGIDFNHLNLSKLNADISDINLNGDTIKVDFDKLSFAEKSGFKVNSLQTALTVTSHSLDFNKLSIKTPQSELNLNLRFDYNNFNKDFADFVNKVETHFSFSPSKLNIHDLSFFVHDFKGMSLPVDISADIKGKINNIKGKNIILKVGDKTYFRGNLTLSGLPMVNETFVNADIQDLHTCKNDLESIQLPESAGNKYLTLPAELEKLGNIRYKGKLTGFLNDFVSYGNIFTDVGIISTDIRLRNNPETKIISYNGKIGTEDLDIGKLLSKEKTLGKVSLQANVAGSGFNFATANVTIDGIIKSIDLNQYTYQNIDINGKFGKKSFNGDIQIDDKNIGLTFAGAIDLNTKIPQFHLSSEIRNANLTKLNFLKEDTLSNLSTNIVMNFKGDNIDNFLGNIEITNTSFIKGKQKFSLNYLSLSNFIGPLGDKINKIDADFMEGEIKGIKSFNGLQNTFLAFLNVYLPSFKFKSFNYINDTVSQNIIYSFILKNSDTILDIIAPSLKIADNTKLYGVYNSENKNLTIQGFSPFIEYRKIRLRDLVIKGKTDKKVYKLGIGCERLMLTDSLYIEKFRIFTKTHNDSINYSIKWDNSDLKVKNSGDISGVFNLSKYPTYEIEFNKSEVYIRDTLLSINQENKIVIDSSSIRLFNFVVGNENQQIFLDGTISDIATDKLNVVFKNFNLSDFDLFTNKMQIDFDGTLNGKATLADLNYSPNIQANINIKKFAFNHEFIGDAFINSEWDNYQQALLVNAEFSSTENEIVTKPIEVKGRYFINKKKDNLDFTINISKLKLDPLGKFLSSFASELTGYASGKIELKGSDSQPELMGTLNFEPAQLKIDYLNTVYHFSNEVTFDPNSISFEDVVLYDEKGKTAKLNGKIFHKNFKEWALSLSILADNFYCLNTNLAQNSDFYGKAYITGLTKIYGTAENINIDVNAKTTKGTQLFIPVSNNSEISDYPYINFVSTSSASDSTNDEVDLSGIKLNFDLEVTPDAEVQIIFDSKSGDILKARGSGNLKLEITTLGDFNMYGDYLIEKGDYLFTVKNIFTKHFEIEKGGTINWNGDPFGATINLSPVYKLRTSLYDLYTKSNPNIQDPDTSKKRVPVECIINMTDNLFNPTISFDIGFPSLNDNVKQQYMDVVRPEINNQFLSLLIMNKFISPNQENSSGTSNNVIGSTTSELLSNQLSNWLSQISNNIDLGLNYRAGDEMNRDEVELALSKGFFNDRLVIDGNVGTGSRSTQSSSSIVGDVNIEYKWNDEGRFRIKAFNKSNEIDILTPNSPYTQGVGIFYRKEFDSFKDLLKRKKNKKLHKSDTLKPISFNKW